MDDGIHFISGLPRSGSTLLAAILRQNPRFHAAMTSPVGAMHFAMEQAMSRRNETAVFIDEASGATCWRICSPTIIVRSLQESSCSTQTGCGALRLRCPG
jgi:hypothetical protein